MKNSPVEVNAVGVSPETGEIFFSMVIDGPALSSWIGGQCKGTTIGLSEYLRESLLVESMRLFDFGQDADVGDVVDIYAGAELRKSGSIGSITETEVVIDGTPFFLDLVSMRYADGKIIEKFQDMTEDVLLSL